MVKPDEVREFVKPLRILTESNSLDLLGGIEICTFQDSTALAARGHTLDLVYGADGTFRSRLHEAGINLEGPESFDMNVHRPIGALARFVRPARWARSRDPDVLLLQRFEHIFWAQAVARWSKCPIVCFLHQKPNFNRTSLLSRGVAHFIAVSNFMRDTWVEAGLTPDRISVIGNALPDGEYPRGGVEERASSREKLGIPVDSSVVLYYGNISKEKGVGTLMEAWAKLGTISDHAQLVLVGSPSPTDDPELSRQFRSLSPASVHWYPLQSDVIPFLHAADLVVFPSWLDEGFGRVVIEGMCTGRPVVASSVGAVPEILSGPMARFLVEPRNPVALGASISSLLRWRETEPELGVECANWVDEKFAYDEHVNALEQVLLKYRRLR